MSAYDTLKSLGITLAPPMPPAAAFEPLVRTGNVLYVSGQIARKDGKPSTGKLGGAMTTADAPLGAPIRVVVGSKCWGG